MFEYHSTITKSPWEMINNQTKKKKKRKWESQSKPGRDWAYKSVNLCVGIICFPFLNGVLHKTVNKGVQVIQHILGECGLCVKALHSELYGPHF